MLSPDGKKKIHIRAEGKPTSRTWILVKLPRKPHHRALLGPISCVLPKVSTPLHDPDPSVYSCRLRHGYKAWWSICLANPFFRLCPSPVVATTRVQPGRVALRCFNGHVRLGSPQDLQDGGKTLKTFRLFPMWPS